MTTRTLVIFTRTPLHVGTGNSVGAIDQPVVRERHTGFPIIPGSGLKGVLRDHLSAQLGKEMVNYVFGRGDEKEGEHPGGTKPPAKFTAGKGLKDQVNVPAKPAAKGGKAAAGAAGAAKK